MFRRITEADGKGEGFGNQISIQTVAIVRAAQATKQVFSVDPGRPVSLESPVPAGEIKSTVSFLQRLLNTTILTDFVMADLACVPRARQYFIIP